MWEGGDGGEGGSGVNFPSPADVLEQQHDPDPV